MPACPRCNSTNVYLSTPDYGYGYGAEFACGCGCRFADKSPEGRAISDASRGRSAANAQAYREKEGGKP